ncbi:MAG: TonB family protein [Halioglobus sp.]
MPALTLQASSPWSVIHEEDRRFRWILMQTLALSLLVGAATPYIRLPSPEAGVATELPPRRVRLLAEPPRPVSKPTLLPAAPAAPAVKPVPTPQTRSEPTLVARVLTPREKAAKSGVLAMADALDELQASTPKTGSLSGMENRDQPGSADPRQPSVLTADLTRGSGGIDGDGAVAHQSVLGAAGLPDRESPRHGNSAPDGGAETGGQISAAAAAGVRSQAAIQEALDRHKGAMYTLYNRELRRDASLQGKLVVSITIAPAGNVTHCVILGSELGSVSLEQQLLALITGIDFGAQPGGAIVTTKIPIEFFPR